MRTKCFTIMEVVEEKYVRIRAFVKKDQIILNINQRKPRAIKNVTFFMRRNVTIALKVFSNFVTIKTCLKISHPWL